MYTLHLQYPLESKAKGAERDILSSNVPQINSTINCDVHYGVWQVVEVNQVIDTGILADQVWVTLAVVEH